MLEVVRASARLDDDLAQTWRQIADDRRARSRKTTKGFLAKAGRRARLNAVDTALTLFSLTGPELYTAHAEERRTPDEYEAWLSHVLRSALLTSS